MALNTLKSLSVTNKRVFVRADLNVPLKNGTITDDFRLEALLPTLQWLQQEKALIVVATHIGKPDPNNPDPMLSTNYLIPWFEQKKIKILHVSDIDTVWTKPLYSPDHIILLENLRFYQGEKTGDLNFAKQLAQCADIYVNEAFATMHRSDASITLVPQQFAQDKRGIGLLVEHEIQELDALKGNPKPPFTLVLGGAKLDDKIHLLTNFLHQPNSQHRVQSVVVGGLPALAFLKAHGQNVGKTIIAAKTVENAKTILKLARDKNVAIQLPVDLTVINGNLGAPWSICKTADITLQQQCVDIGPETAKLFASIIHDSKTVFMNGTMGIFEYPDYQQGTRDVLAALSHNQGKTVVGGGDTVAAITACGLKNRISFISTGGGATLAYLGAKDPITELPGLKVLATA